MAGTKFIDPKLTHTQDFPPDFLAPEAHPDAPENQNPSNGDVDGAGDTDNSENSGSDVSDGSVDGSGDTSVGGTDSESEGSTPGDVYIVVEDDANLPNDAMRPQRRRTGDLQLLHDGDTIALQDRLQLSKHGAQTDHAWRNEINLGDRLLWQLKPRNER